LETSLSGHSTAQLQHRTTTDALTQMEGDDDDPNDVDDFYGLHELFIEPSGAPISSIEVEERWAAYRIQHWWQRLNTKPSAEVTVDRMVSIWNNRWGGDTDFRIATILYGAQGTKFSKLFPMEVKLVEIVQEIQSIVVNTPPHQPLWKCIDDVTSLFDPVRMTKYTIDNPAVMMPCGQLIGKTSAEYMISKGMRCPYTRNSFCATDLHQNETTFLVNFLVKLISSADEEHSKGKIHCDEEYMERLVCAKQEIQDAWYTHHSEKRRIKVLLCELINRRNVVENRENLNEKNKQQIQANREKIDEDMEQFDAEKKSFDLHCQEEEERQQTRITLLKVQEHTLIENQTQLDVLEQDFVRRKAAFAAREREFATVQDKDGNLRRIHHLLQEHTLQNAKLVEKLAVVSQREADTDIMSLIKNLTQREAAVKKREKRAKKQLEDAASAKRVTDRIIQDISTKEKELEAEIKRLMNRLHHAEANRHQVPTHQGVSDTSNRSLGLGIHTSRLSWIHYGLLDLLNCREKMVDFIPNNIIPSVNRHDMLCFRAINELQAQLNTPELSLQYYVSQNPEHQSLPFGDFLDAFDDIDTCDSGDYVQNSGLFSPEVPGIGEWVPFAPVRGGIQGIDLRLWRIVTQDGSCPKGFMWMVIRSVSNLTDKALHFLANGNHYLSNHTHPVIVNIYVTDEQRWL